MPGADDYFHEIEVWIGDEEAEAMLSGKQLRDVDVSVVSDLVADIRSLVQDPPKDVAEQHITAMIVASELGTSRITRLDGRKRR